MTRSTAHAKERAAERLGAHPEFEPLVMAIIATADGLSAVATLVSRWRDGKELWDVPFETYVIRVIYNPDQARIITVYGWVDQITGRLCRAGPL